MTLVNENFLIAKRMRKLICVTHKLILNIPKKDYIYRDEFRKTLINTLNSIYIANEYNKEDKYNQIVNIKANISMIDFYIELFFNQKYISEKQLGTITREFESILKMSVSWLKKYKK